MSGSLLAPLGEAFGTGDASWNGVPFVAQGQEHRAGRRTAVHEYPWRDEVWVEDLGRAVRGKRVNGFLVGSDVALQRAAMRRAVETPGPGELVLPTEGRITCCLVGYSDSETWDEGRVVRLQFEFVEGGPQGVRRLPATVRDTRAAVAEAADAAASASSRSWLQRVGDVGQNGVLPTLLGRNESFARAGYATALGETRFARGVVDAVEPYATAATRLVGDASRVVGAVRGLAGDFGRFSFGRLSSGTSSGARLRVTSPGAISGVQGAVSRVERVEGQVRNVIGAATQARATVQRAAEGLGRLAGLL